MDHPDLITRSMEELHLKTEVHDRFWQLGEANWNINQETCEVVFSAPNGTIATCPVQIIGTFNTNDSTWLWGWDHPSVRPALSVHAQRLREYGETHGINELVTRMLETNEEACWEFTALACHLNEAQGAYRAPTGVVHVYITFGEPSLSGGSQACSDLEATGDADPEFTPDVPVEVRLFVRKFIKALCDWEVAAYQATEVHGWRSASDIAQQAFQTLVREWCVPELKPQPISFSSQPHHNPDTEEILSAALNRTDCRVRTRHSDLSGFASDYEYHLKRIDGKWRVSQLYYLDDAEKYESL